MKRGVRGDWAYQAAVGMLASDGCTQSNGSSEMQEAGVRMAWCWRRVRTGEESVVRFDLLEERGLETGIRATSKKWALDQKSPP